MKIIKINPQNPQKEIINEAVNVLVHGGIIVYPTDTCYGLGADITNKIAFAKIYEIKKRAQNKPVSVIVKNEKQIYSFAIVKPFQEKYIQKYFPGQVTLIFLTLDQDIFPFSSIGIRIPNYRVTQMIADELDTPYVTTSANIASYPPSYEIKDFLNQLSTDDPKPDLLLDAGKLTAKNLSTVVDLTGSKIKILRQGTQTIKEL